MRVTDLIDHPQPREPQLTPPLTPRRVNAELIHLPSMLAVPGKLQCQPLQMNHYSTQGTYNHPTTTDGLTARHHTLPAFLLPPPGENVSVRATTDLEVYHQDNTHGSPSLSNSSRESPSFTESYHSPIFHADVRIPSHHQHRASPKWVDHAVPFDLHIRKHHIHPHGHHSHHQFPIHHAQPQAYPNAHIKAQHSPPHTAPSSPPTSCASEPPRPFHCTYCSSSFKRRQTLDEHIASKHLDLRAHPCDVPGCGASFHRRQDKLRHFRSCHAGDELRVFMCKGCNRTFARLDSLRKHLRTRKGKTQCVPAMQEKGEECV